MKLNSILSLSRKDIYSFEFPFLGRLKTKTIPNRLFFKEEVGDKIGKMISDIARMTKDTRFVTKLTIEICGKKEKPKIRAPK